MLRVLIERPSVGTGDASSSQKHFRAALKKHPGLARELKVEFCGSDEEREAKLRNAEVFVAWQFPTKDLARRAPGLKWIQLTGAGVEHLLPLDWLPNSLPTLSGSSASTPKP